MKEQVNKKIAHEVAVKLADETIGKKIVDKIQQVADGLAKEHLKKTGAATLKHIKAIPSGFIDYEDGFCFSQFSNPSITFKFKQPIPVHVRNSYRQLEKIINDHFLKELSCINKMRNDREKLIGKIEGSLLQLRWYENVTKEFPEAAKYLPERIKAQTAIAIPMADLRKEINSYNK